jgi:hypothetical protein
MYLVSILSSLLLQHAMPESNHYHLYDASSVPEALLGLRTYGGVMYNGMEIYDCAEAISCGQLDEIDTARGVAKLKNGGHLSLRRRGEPAASTEAGRPPESTEERSAQWTRPSSPPPRSVPRIANYTFAKAYRVVATDTYVGLWNRPGGDLAEQTIVVLFDGGSVRGSAAPATCGSYTILASLPGRADILEVRPIHHIGEAINVAGYDQGSKALWVARMILPEGQSGCAKR